MRRTLAWSLGLLTLIVAAAWVQRGPLPLAGPRAATPGSAGAGTPDLPAAPEERAWHQVSDAVAREDASCVEALIRSSGDEWKGGPLPGQILTLAVQASRWSLVELLLKHGVPLDERTALQLPREEDPHDGNPRGPLRDLEVAFGELSDPERAPAALYSVLGTARLRVGEVAGAASAYERALRRDPGNPQLARRLARARRLQRLSRRSRELLRPGESVVNVAPVPFLPGREAWVLLTGDSTSEPGNSFDLHLNLVEARGERVTRAWRAPAFGSEAAFDTTAMYIHDLTGDGAPEIAVYGGSENSLSQFGDLHIFHWQNGGLRKVFTCSSHRPVWFEDYDRDGRMEIGVPRTIGWTVSYGHAPFWPDVFSWRRGKFVQVNSEFPEAFEGMDEWIEMVLAEGPDYELLKHLGEVYEIRGERWGAVAAYRRAQAIVRNLLIDPDEHWVEKRPILRSELREMERRLRESGRK